MLTLQNHSIKIPLMILFKIQKEELCREAANEKLNFYLDTQTAFSCDPIHVLAIYVSYLVLASGAFSPIQFSALGSISSRWRSRDLVLAHTDLEEGNSKQGMSDQHYHVKKSPCKDISHIDILMCILICGVRAIGFFSLIFLKQISDSVTFSTLHNFF